MNSTSFTQFDQNNPEIYQAWVMVACEHRLDPWRTLLSASEVIETLRRKGFTLANDHKPYYARKFNAQHNDGGLLFKCHRLQQA